MTAPFANLRLRAAVTLSCVFAISAPCYAQEPVDTGPAGPRPQCTMTPGPDCIFLPNELSERPQLIRQRLPPGLLRSDIQGAVRLSFVVDTTGHVEAASLGIVNAPDSALAHVARQLLLSSLYTPGRIYGTPVRVRLVIPIVWGGTPGP
jgi:Gram-negative bacterial TonB protein C-terminal